MRDLGTLGEKAFTSWCTEGEITATRPDIDHHGWDYYLEFHSENNNEHSLDMQPAPLECKVQIKSTDGESKEVQFWLSNLHRLIKTPMPVFVCFIEFNGNNKPESAYLVHLGEDIIRHTLKRLRKADILGKKDKIHEEKITIKYDDSHKIDSLDGISLRKAILSHIKNGLEEYTSHKDELVKSLGFEDGSVHITFETQDFDSLNDVFLGIKPEVSIVNLIASNYRFGIKDLHPLYELEKSKLSIPDLPVFAEGEIIFKEHLLSRGISFPCKVYDSRLMLIPRAGSKTKKPKSRARINKDTNKNLAEELFKFNVKGELFNFVGSPE